MSRALILIDIQEGFDDPAFGARNNPEAEARAADLLAKWRAAGAPVIHIQHHSTTPGSPLHPETGRAAIKAEVAPLPSEPVLTKEVNSAFIGTDLETYLSAHGITDIALCGLTTPHCVSTTARMGANLGFDVVIAHDACAAFAANAHTDWRGGGKADPKFIHQAALDHLSGEFAAILPSAEVTPEVTP